MFKENFSVLVPRERDGSTPEIEEKVKLDVYKSSMASVPVVTEAVTSTKIFKLIF